MKASKHIFYSSICILFLFFKSNAQHKKVAEEDDNSYYNEDAHVFETIESCNSLFHENFNEEVTKSVCKPRPKLVEVFPYSTNTLLFPHMAVLNRCDGACKGNHSCIATEKKDVQVKIHKINLFGQNYMAQCGHVRMEEHVRCECNCSAKKEDCNQEQELSEDLCMCICKNKDEGNVCLEEGWNWDMVNCSCN